jgi:hypothetical protein
MFLLTLVNVKSVITLPWFEIRLAVNEIKMRYYA